jgi:hypothetical protein
MRLCQTFASAVPASNRPLRAGVVARSRRRQGRALGRVHGRVQPDLPAEMVMFRAFIQRLDRKEAAHAEREEQREDDRESRGEAGGRRGHLRIIAGSDWARVNLLGPYALLKGAPPPDRRAPAPPARAGSASCRPRSARRSDLGRPWRQGLHAQALIPSLASYVSTREARDGLACGSTRGASTYPRRARREPKRLMVVDVALGPAHGEVRVIRTTGTAVHAGSARGSLDSAKHDLRVSLRETPLQRVQRLSRELDEAEADLDRELAAAAQHQQRDRLRLLEGGRSKMRTAVRWRHDRGGRKTS